MSFKFGNVALSAWKGFCVASQIDEPKENIDKLIIYEDHGDDFEIVKTKDGKIYKYGYFINLKYPPTSYVRETTLLRKEDERSAISNKIFFKIYGDYGENFIDRMTFRICKDSKATVDCKLRALQCAMKDIYNSGVMYHVDQYKDIVKDYLLINDAYDEENAKILDEIVFNSSYYGIDGVAGKIDITGTDRVYGDRIKYAWSNGKRIRIKSHYAGSDEWGVSIYYWKV